MRWAEDLGAGPEMAISPLPAAAGALPGRGGARRRVAGGGVGAPRGPAHAVFARDDTLRYKTGDKKFGASAGRLEAYRNARSVGEFLDCHPGPAVTTSDCARAIALRVAPLGNWDPHVREGWEWLPLAGPAARHLWTVVRGGLMEETCPRW